MLHDLGMQRLVSNRYDEALPFFERVLSFQSFDAYTVDGVKRLADKGITDLIVGFRNPYVNGADTEPLEAKIKHLEWYADNIIAKVDR